MTRRERKLFKQECQKETINTIFYASLGIYAMLALIGLAAFLLEQIGL